MQALGWMALALVLALLAAAGAVWWARWERRGRLAAEADLVGLGRRVDVADHRVEQLEAELVQVTKARLAAERQAREASELAHVRSLPDQAVADQLVASLAGLAARRAAAAGCRGGDAATCDTAPDLLGLGARHAPAGVDARLPAPPLPAGPGLPAGAGGGRGAGGAQP